MGRSLLIGLAVFGALALVVDSAFAHGGGRGRGGGFHGGGFRGGGHSRGFHHFRGGGAVFLGVPFYYGPSYFYPTPYYYPPAPTYYIERPQPGYWHYCPPANGYYPQVQTCPSGWQLVPAQPQSGY